jgi:D-arabinose 1-dehydrogenase-like Zn-dependent alcohol dehydrogenase
MGAHHFVVTSEKGWAKPLEHELDLIVSTTNCSEDYPLKDYLSLLTVHGKFVSVGLPEAPFPTIRAQDFMAQGALLGASHIGNKKEVLQMLDIAAKQNIKSWIQCVPLSEAGCKEVRRLPISFLFAAANDQDRLLRMSTRARHGTATCSPTLRMQSLLEEDIRA